MIKAIIFDFDGTIADSFEIFVETISEVLKRPPLTDNEVKTLRGSTISVILKYLKVRNYQIPKLLLKGRSEIAKKMNRVNIFDGMADVITQLSKKGYTIYILSSNSVSSIQTFLKKNEINQYIADIRGGISIMGKSSQLKKLLKQYRLNVTETVYIGDEVRDIEATARIGMKCISVSWGFSTKESLDVLNGANVVSTPAELLQKILNT